MAYVNPYGSIAGALSKGIIGAVDAYGKARDTRLEKEKAAKLSERKQTMEDEKHGLEKQKITEDIAYRQTQTKGLQSSEE